MQHRLRIAHKAVTRPTAFRYSGPPAHHVSLAVRPASGGHLTTHPMHKDFDGSWHLTIELARGRYLYRFVADGVPVLDPHSRGRIHDDQGGDFSTREVG